jgi:hypothetical protein
MFKHPQPAPVFTRANVNPTVRGVPVRRRSATKLLRRRRNGGALASHGAPHHAWGMFVITEDDAAAIRAVFNQEGELSAVIELRRRFPGVTDNAKARACARSIAGWTPLPAQLRPVTKLRSRKGS